MKIIIIICIAIVLPCLVSAQSAKDEFQQLMESHTGEKDYNYKVKYSFFGEGQAKPIESLEAISQKFGELSYFKLGPLEQVCSKIWLITVNSEEKYIIADKPEKYESYKLDMDFKTILSDIQENGKEMSVEKNGDASSVLKIFETEGNKPSWTITYDRNSMHISGLSVYFDKEETETLTGEEFNSSRLDITISYLEPSVPKLQVENVLAITDKQVGLQANYKKYALHNLSAKK